jgi:importin subunit beta-1
LITSRVLALIYLQNDESLNFSLRYSPNLVPLLCHNLLKQAEAVDEDDEWTVAAAAAACITILSECLGDNLVSTLVPFIQLINDANWRQREASTMAFGSITSGSESEQFKAMTQEIMGTLLAHIGSDPNECVRATSAWTVGRIAEFHGDIIQKDVKAVLGVLVGALSQEEPVIAAHACYGIFHVLNNVYSDRSDDETNELSQFFAPLFTELMKAGDREDASSAKLRVVVYEAINTLIEVAPKDCLQQAATLIPPFLQKLEQSFQATMELEDQIQYQSYIPLVLQTITQRIGKGVMPNAEMMYKRFVEIFDNRKMILDEPMNGIAMLFSILPEVIPGVLPSFTPYFYGAIKNARDVSVLKSGLVCLGALCDGLQENLYLFDNGQLCNTVLGSLISHLQDPEVDRYLRALIITSFGDIAMAIKTNIVNYYPHIISILSAASDIPITANDDEDTIDYVIALREAILECFPVLVIQMCDAKQASAVIPSLSKMIPFMEVLWNQTDYRTTHILSSMVSIVK